MIEFGDAQIEPIQFSGPRIGGAMLSLIQSSLCSMGSEVVKILDRAPIGALTSLCSLPTAVYECDMAH